MTSDQVRDELVKLRRSIDALTAGLSLMQDAMSAQTSMLKALMAAAAPDEDGSPLQEVLVRLAQAVEQNNAEIQRNTEVVHRLTRPNDAKLTGSFATNGGHA